MGWMGEDNLGLFPVWGAGSGAGISVWGGADVDEFEGAVGGRGIQLRISGDVNCPPVGQVRQALEIGKTGLSEGAFSIRAEEAEVLFAWRSGRDLSSLRRRRPICSTTVCDLSLNIAIFGSPAKAEYCPNWFELSDCGRIESSGATLLQYLDFLSVNVCAMDG